MPFTVWQACPAPLNTGWLQWQPVAGHVIHPLVQQLEAADAHAIARQLRRTFPGHLFAVRPADAGQPVCADPLA